MLYILHGSSEPARLSHALRKVSVKNSQLVQEQFAKIAQLVSVDTCMCPLKILAPFAAFNQT